MSFEKVYVQVWFQELATWKQAMLSAFLSSGTRLSAQAEGLACEIDTKRVVVGGRFWIYFTALPTHPPLSQSLGHVTRNQDF